MRCAVVLRLLDFSVTSNSDVEFMINSILEEYLCAAGCTQILAVFFDGARMHQHYFTLLTRKKVTVQPNRSGIAFQCVLKLGREWCLQSQRTAKS